MTRPSFRQGRGVSSAGLKIVIYTATPGSDDETKLDLARIGGIIAPKSSPAS